MTTAAATPNNRDPFMPRRPPGMRSGLALALLAHAVLIAGLAYSVDWHASEPIAVEAELWSAVPQQAAPRSEAPPPAAPPPPAPAPAPAPKPPPAPPAPPPQIDPQIAIEKAREAKRVLAQQELAEQEKARRDKAKRDQARQDEAERKAAEQQAREDQQRKKQLADKQQADREKAEQAKLAKAEAAKSEAARQAYLKRIQGMAGATGASNATGNALKSSGESAGYAGRIVARIKPNIVFPDSVDGNPMASVEVRVAPDGTITGKHLVQSSGVRAWDDAVLRAIDRTDGLPRDVDGRVPPVMTINFRPRDL